MTNMISLISTDVLAIIALCFTISFAKRNVVICNKKNMIYISAASLTIILLLLEITTILMELSSNNKLMIPHRIANILGFFLSPIVPFVLLFFNSNKEKKFLHNCFLTIPLCINAFMCVLSYKTGSIFFVDAQNQYTRGNLFLLPTIICIFYYVLLVIAVIKNSIRYDMEDKKFLIPILFIPILGSILQILFKNLILIWSCASISLLIYYIFLLELQFKYDVQTGIKNRASFDNEMKQYVTNDKNATIVMFDLNDLKSTNDNHGHKAGDEMIFDTAKIIEESFIGIGKAYRIGGDEFCVICSEIPMELLESTLSDLDDFLIKVNQKRNIKIVLAYGHASYNKNENESIYSTFVQADKNMYIHKSKLKHRIIHN
ncbi:GGDEF domain-containing protein [Clostridium lacusfryxellense]|uniref:GGDEF domain-containing protein n=1 Tax=Clostridium lacusfryxellense TaxID=205328 RepID=UPI001C0C6564|nr:GGDEF domain-containing protein [Clostridium lacusfryxellense]MBU3110343.1 GGDEF domain-containing protein [Clostridium lacusfryxellense]